MACLAAFHQAHNAARSQPANRFARRACGKVDIVRQPWNRKPQPPFSFQPAVSQQMDIHKVVDHWQPKPWHHDIFHLFPQRPRVDSFLRAVCFKRERRAAFLPSFS